MKKLLSLLLCWAFALTAPCALADTVAERTGAPERVTLSEARGGAQLVFDAPVQAPYGCRIPILEARSRKVSVEELQRALDCLLGEGNYIANINIYDATLEVELQLVPAWAFYGNAYAPDEACAVDWRPLVTVHAVSGMALNFNPYELR